MRKSSEINSQSETPSKWRWFWLAIILASMALYFPINHLSHGGIELSISLDQHISLYPPFIIPYLLGSLLFIGLPVWAAFHTRSVDFESYASSLLLATAVSYLVYLLFPTYVTRPVVVSNDIFSRAISILYQADLAYNAAPSGHAFYSTISFLYLARWKPQFKLIWLASWLIILASTLFTRQHNILDLVSGVILGLAAYAAGIYISRKRVAGLTTPRR